MREREKKKYHYPQQKRFLCLKNWRQSYNVIISIALPSARVNMKILVACILSLRNNALHFLSGKKLSRVIPPENNNPGWLLMPNFQDNLPSRCSRRCKNGWIITSPEIPKKTHDPYTETCCRAKQLSWKSMQTLRCFY